ncbi:tRNA lysidine(34) synthetase TilS [Aurantiacibacter hainanensis]|uniref:tRNA lysidine(34) synthetase TilS n=1 Tax=Aurantiacibacter hainanensis TaxID=3076114 RepID=UPI0030C669E3
MAGSTAIDPALVERFREALDRLNPQGGKLGLAVSGGPDSMAMLLLAQEAIPGGFEVATVDHGLRPEAKDECALVVAACEERGVRCEVLSVEVGEGNVQAQAREARYRALADWAKRRGLPAIATAHHADDHAETLLMRLNRGSGLSGLAGVREQGWTPSRLRRLIRPLLRFRRAELRSLAEAGIRFVDDPSNADDRFDRSRLRKALANADWLDIEAVAASARHLADADSALEWCTNLLRETHCYADRGVYGIEKPQRLPRLLQLSFVEEGLNEFGGVARGGQVAELVKHLLAGRGGNLAGVMVSVEDGNWVFRPEPPRRTG